MKGKDFSLFKWWFILPLVGITAIVPYTTFKNSRSSFDLDSEVGRLPEPDSVFRYTPPIKLKRLTNEWEPQQALLLSLSFPEAQAFPDIAESTLRILEAAHPYLNIYVFCEHEHSRAFAYFLSLVRELPQGEAILEKTQFVDSRNLMRWIRDFGPIFGIGPKKQLVAIDYVYRNMLKDLESLALQKKDAFRDFMTLHGDAMPADVVALLQNDFDVPVDIVRPPLSMDGGDLLSDGQGNLFISTQTLARNGGNREALQRVFQLYFGAKKLHVMEALPGASVRHLDLIIKFVDADTVMLPEFKIDPEANINPYRIELNKKVLSVLEKNERYFRKYFPQYKIVKVPMPPILFLSQEEIFLQTKQEFFSVFVKDRRLLSNEELAALTEPQRIKMEEQVIALIKKEKPYANFETINGFNSLLLEYGQLPLERYIGFDADSVTRYRSYINSVFLHTVDGKQAFLIPQFTANNDRDNALLKEWEATTEKVYKSVWPKADIRWLNCDNLVEEMGFIHCMTVTVPASPFR